MFDVAYLLGTGMSAEIRNANEIKILQHYYCELDAAGANLDQYSFDDLVKDYRICLGSPLRCMQSRTFTIVVL